MSLTASVRQELARDLPTLPCDRDAMLAGLVRAGGSLHRRGTDDGDLLRVEVSSRSGAVARAAFTLFESVTAELPPGPAPHGRPELAVHEAGGVRTTPTYTVAAEGDAARLIGERAGLLDEHGHPRRDPPQLEGACDRRAFVRGAMLARGTLSGPGRPAHLEIVVGTRPVAEVLAGAVDETAGHRPSVTPARDRWRVVVKSRTAIGQLLGSVGATGSYLEWEDGMVRRQVRRAAIRLANADAANVRRSVDAAMLQLRTVERAIDAVGWGRLDDDLRQVALARLTNPEASLAEVGALCHPPIGKSAVHRRMERLAAIAAETGTAEDG
jgi:cell division protein WhiA